MYNVYNIMHIKLHIILCKLYQSLEAAAPGRRLAVGQDSSFYCREISKGQFQGRQIAKSNT
jgi:hypothetical protein